MAVLLKNLVARTPQIHDLQAISRLIATCEGAGAATGEQALEQLLPCWQHENFQMATDAWMIATRTREVVGFACVWCDAPGQISTFICVSPAYRNRGIGTLLLRVVEMRARQHAQFAQAGERVILRGLINLANAGAQNLFDREGYQAGEQVIRVVFHHMQASRELPIPGARTYGIADASVMPTWPEAAPSQDDLCTICLYRVYEKELRPASAVCLEADHYAVARASRSKRRPRGAALHPPREYHKISPAQMDETPLEQQNTLCAPM